MSDQVDAFLAKRSWADRRTVEDMERWNARNNVPWCGECKDWHGAGEEHSS